MKTILEKTYAQQSLTEEEAYNILLQMGQGEVSEVEMTAFISAFNMKEIAIEELKGFRQALLELCLPVKLETENTIDLCGTGGDGKNTFNVSTITAFVIAACGHRVIKHGNYGVSSLCGSSNVLEALGYSFSTDSDQLQKQLDRVGICFLHAPLFHPAMKHVAPIRKTLRLKTFFNLLGPLVNPAQPDHQVVGVYNLKVARNYRYILQNERKSFQILHNLDGYDEATLTGSLKVLSKEGEALYTPADLGGKKLAPEALYGGNTVEESAKLFTQILSGNGTPEQTQVIRTNAALALRCFDGKLSIEEASARASEAIQSGKAIQKLEQLINA